MTTNTHRVARNGGDLAMRVGNKTLLVTTTGIHRDLHLTITQAGQPPATITLNRRQLRMLTAHIHNNI